MLSQLTNSVLETALEAELTEHLGHEHGGTPIAEDMRNGTRVKTLLTEIGPVEIMVPGDRDGSFERVIVLGGERVRSWNTCRNPPSDLHHERDRIDQRPVPARGPGARAFPQRGCCAETSLSRDEVA
ncbi:hypothetical protein GCM10010401_07600 [Rarobacter faecitabidus]